MTFNSLKEFYPFYLGEHKNQTCKVLHFFGTFMVILSLAAIITTGNWAFFPLLLVVGYAPAWTGHFFFEKNRPATFKWPFYSLASDFIMFWHLLTGKLSFHTNAVLKVKA